MTSSPHVPALFSLAGKTALVTGGGQGIGAAVCRRFAQAGAVLHVLDLDADRAASVAEALPGGGHRFWTCDVSDHDSVAETIRQIADGGALDVLVNNAAVAHIGTAETTTPEDLDRIYRINVKGVYNVLHAALPVMKAGGGGAIINLASVASVVAVAERFAYSMSKGAVLTMTYSVAKDFLADGIRCNAIAPARIHTPFVDGYLAQHYPGHEQEQYDRLAATQPIGRMGTPEEVAALAHYLASDEAAFVTGTVYPIDGGFITLNG